MNARFLLGCMIVRLALCVPARGEEPTWKAGIARAVITPEKGVWLAGYGTKRPPEGKLHDLWMKALALEDPAGQRVVLITSDFQGVPKEMSDRVFEQLLKELPNSIRRLEDTKGDGRFDRHTIFADKMSFPMGVLWHDGSVYTCSPPSLWRLQDTQRTGVADVRQELVTRFGFEHAMWVTAALTIVVLVAIAGLCVGKPPDLRGIAQASVVERDAVDQPWTRARALKSLQFWTMTLPFAFGIGAQVGFLVHQIAFLELNTD